MIKNTSKSIKEKKRRMTQILRYLQINNIISSSIPHPTLSEL